MPRTGSRRGRSTPARIPIRTPARSCRPSPSPRRSRRRRSASTRAMSTRRSGNPTRTTMETCLASLEGAGNGLAFASGLAAEDAVLRTLDPGDHLILPNDAYGGTFRLAAHVHERFGLAWSACDLRDLDALAAEWRDETRLVWIETPTNPMLNVVDIEAVARIAHRARGAGHRRQHVRHAIPATAARARRRRVVALVDEVSRRALRRRRRLHRARTTPSGPTSCASSRTRWAQCRRRSTATSCCGV